MIANKMPILTINHKTEYRYAHPVAFGEHRIMLRPLPGHDLRILAHDLAIEPRPMSLRWIHDVFGNSVAIANFDERAETLTFTSTVTVEHDPAAFELTPDDPTLAQTRRLQAARFHRLAGEQAELTEEPAGAVGPGDERRACVAPQRQWHDHGQAAGNLREPRGAEHISGHGVRVARDRGNREQSPGDAGDVDDVRQDVKDRLREGRGALGVADKSLPAAVEAASFRIAEAALANVASHANARDVVIRLRRNDDEHVPLVDFHQQRLGNIF